MKRVKDDYETKKRRNAFALRLLLNSLLVCMHAVIDGS